MRLSSQRSVIDSCTNRSYSSISRKITIESRGIPTLTESRKKNFLLQKKYEIPERLDSLQKSQLTPQKVRHLMVKLGQAESYLKGARTYKKFKAVKESLQGEGLEHEETLRSSSYKKVKAKRVMTPIRIPRAGFNIDCVYKYEY